MIKSIRMRWEEQVARVSESRDAYRVLVGKPEGKRPSEIPRRRKNNNIKMYFQEEGWGHGLD
jgi:hypothetical protein